MKNYPKKVYISASWKLAEAVFSAAVVEKLIKKDITVVGDHDAYKEKDPFDRTWIERIHSVTADCCALVAIFPKRDTKQTTSPFMFPELISASIHKIPILILNQSGVEIKSIKTNSGFNLHFGGSISKKVVFDSFDIIKNKKTLKEIDGVLTKLNVLRLNTSANLSGPHELPDCDLDSVVSSFLDKIERPKRESYVFNIIPFSLIECEHREIAKVVFRETGFPCKTALDTVGYNQDMRSNWESSIRNAEIVIAELSQLRGSCVFESGVAVGLDSELYVLTKNKTPDIPYGLDNKPVKVYSSISDLKEKVREYCQIKYRRKIYNLEPEYNKILLEDKKAKGIPDWYFDEPQKYSPMLMNSISLWLFNFTFSGLVCFLFWLSGATDTPLSFFGVFLALFYGSSQYIKKATEKLEEKFIGKSKKVLLSSVVLFVFFIGFAFVVIKRSEQLTDFFRGVF